MAMIKSFLSYAHVAIGAMSIGQLFSAWGLRGPASNLVLAITHPGVAVVALDSPTWVDAPKTKVRESIGRKGENQFC